MAVRVIALQSTDTVPLMRVGTPVTGFFLGTGPSNYVIVKKQMGNIIFCLRTVHRAGI